MDKSRFLIEPFGRKSLLVILASILLVTTVLSEVAPSQVREDDKQKIVYSVAQKWIQVGMEQYKRGFFKAAEQSFLRAQDYEEYLTAAEREELRRTLEKAHLAVLERERILEHIQTADELEKQGELIKAKAHLERVKDSKFLAEAERGLIAEGLKKIDNQLTEQKKEIAELYNRSVKFFRSGQYEKAREGFIKVARSGLFAAPKGEKTAEEYLAEIDNTLAQRARPSPSIESKPPVKLAEPPLAAIEDELLDVEAEAAKSAEQRVVQEQEKPATVTVAEPKVPEAVTDKGSYIEVIKRKRNILRSHTRAVVNDAVDKAQRYISQGKFDEAREVVEMAERLVNENHLHLGDDVFSQCNGQLKQLTVKIIQGENKKSQQLQEHKRVEAVEAQRRYREQMELDRSKRITELTDNAMAYQKQQRYEEALGQLESLLAIEPLNDQALILKQTLDDMINFRKQLEIQKEKDKQRFATLIRTDEAMIPYAEELTYPKNWREIVAKRKPEEAIGYDPASAAVYKQLGQIVDLSELAPEMPLSEAIGIFKNSIEPPLKIIVLWRDLYDNADIDQTTPINMDAISAVPLGTALELLLKSVSGGFANLGYVVEGGIITVATIESLPSKLETLVYDVTDLLGRPADFYAVSGGEISVSGGAGVAGGETLEGGEELDREQLAESARIRAENLVLLIQETVEPDSWYDAGGEGTIRVYENKKLIILQRREIHNQIAELLKEMRKAFGHQVAIEARFLLVGENFLEDIGLDIDIYRPPLAGLDWVGTEWEAQDMTGGVRFIPGEFSDNEVYAPYDPDGKPPYPVPYTDGDPEFGPDPRLPEPVVEPGETPPPLPMILLNPLREIISEPYFTAFEQFVSPTGRLGAFQRHAEHTRPEDTGLPGSWPALMYPFEGEFIPGLELGIGGMILDTLQVDLLLRATQAHRDAASLTAPKVSVLSGESATMRVQRIMRYPYDIEIDVEELGDYGDFRWTVDYEEGAIVTGTLLNITPTITPDKKNVLLNIVTEMRDFLGFEPFPIQLPILGKGAVPGAIYTILEPETEISRVETRVSVPDGGTLLLGGQKVTTEVERESGVPVLSKIPFLGRLFSNRSKIKDEKILLILVKPTIILQEEAEAEAIAAMQ